MKMMRLLSNRARQNVTYMCQNSIAWSDQKYPVHRRTVKVLTDDEVELHGNARDTDIFLDIRLDECKVLRFLRLVDQILKIL